MTEVRRYTHRLRLSDFVIGQPAPMPAGEYVLASDYDALAARVQELESRWAPIADDARKTFEIESLPILLNGGTKGQERLCQIIASWHAADTAVAKLNQRVQAVEEINRLATINLTGLEQRITQVVADKADMTRERDGAEQALRSKGYRKECDIAACNCGPQWNHGGDAEARLREIDDALPYENGATILKRVEGIVRQLAEAQETIEKQREELSRFEHRYLDMIQRNRILRTRPDLPLTHEEKATYKRLEQQVARLLELLSLSKCATCDGCGWYGDTDLVTGEPVQAQCWYCTEMWTLCKTRTPKEA